MNGVDLEYFKNKEVLIGCTPKVMESLGQETVAWVMSRIFANAYDYRSEGIRVDNVQLVEFERISIEGIEPYIEMEGKEYVEVVRFIQGDKSAEKIVYDTCNLNEFIGTVVVEEFWNGIESDQDKHYIMMYFKEEENVL